MKMEMGSLISKNSKDYYYHKDYHGIALILLIIYNIDNCI